MAQPWMFMMMMMIMMIFKIGSVQFTATTMTVKSKGSNN
jgi:hypothetical protein